MSKKCKQCRQQGFPYTGLRTMERYVLKKRGQAFLLCKIWTYVDINLSVGIYYIVHILFFSMKYKRNNILYNVRGS